MEDGDGGSGFPLGLILLGLLGAGLVVHFAGKGKGLGDPELPDEEEEVEEEEDEGDEEEDEDDEEDTDEEE